MQITWEYWRRQNEELLRRVVEWQETIERKDLHVNAKKDISR